MQTNIPDKNGQKVDRQTTGDRLQQLFIENNDLYPWQAYRLLKSKSSFRGGYQWIRKLFYVARRLGLISFSHEGEGKTQIPKRFYKLISGHEADPRWHLLHSELYPKSAIGGLHYTELHSPEAKDEN